MFCHTFRDVWRRLLNLSLKNNKHIIAVICQFIRVYLRFSIMYTIFCGYHRWCLPTHKKYLSFYPKILRTYLLAVDSLNSKKQCHLVCQLDDTLVTGYRKWHYALSMRWWRHDNTMWLKSRYCQFIFTLHFLP